MYALRFDGLFRSIQNPAGPTDAKAGIMCYGWLIFKQDRLIAKGHGAFADGENATSNVAEYLALIEGLEALLDLGVRDEPVKVTGDAKCVIEQLLGVARVNSERIRPLHRKASRLTKRFTCLSLAWTPRRENREADALTRRAMRQVRHDQKNYQVAIDYLLPKKWRGRGRASFLPVLDLRIYMPALRTQ